MKILQNKKDGSGRIIFTDEEIEILKDKGYFEITAASLKHIGNSLVKLAAELHEYLPEEALNLMTHENDHIKVHEKDIKKLSK
jgi:hypothetical protein